MSAQRRLRLAALAIAPLLTAPLRAAEEATDPRPELEAAQAVLDQAVSEVSRPSFHVVLGGREAARGYRLRGVGAIFVLPPRVLPPPERQRDQVFVIGDPHRGPTTIVRRRHRDQEREIREIQIQVENLQREAEASQREALRAFEQVEQNIRVRLDAPAAPAPPAPPPAPSAPDVPTPPTPAVAPLPPPPWRFWFENEEPDPRTPERVISDVQAAVTGALEALGPRLRVVPADEAVLVAVDFLPARGFAMFEPDEPPAPTKSLIVKVKKRDLLDKSAGKIGAEELRRRIEVTQY